MVCSRQPARRARSSTRSTGTRRQFCSLRRQRNASRPTAAQASRVRLMNSRLSSRLKSRNGRKYSRRRGSSRSDVAANLSGSTGRPEFVSKRTRSLLLAGETNLLDQPCPELDLLLRENRAVLHQVFVHDFRATDSEALNHRLIAQYLEHGR